MVGEINYDKVRLRAEEMLWNDTELKNVGGRGYRLGKWDVKTQLIKIGKAVGFGSSDTIITCKII